jgi:SagB-type dehydrogenase family enzyme
VRKTTEKASLRIVPSGGARHPFETYLFVSRVEGLDQGLYRYLPFDHALARVKEMQDFEETLDRALLKHLFGGAVAFVWTAIPYRSEWKYAFEASRLCLMDAGHLCQNLYLACEALGCGTCAVGAYDQEAMDELLGVDGEEEFTVYAAPVGKAE